MALCKEGKTSLLSFLCACSLSVVYFITELFQPLSLVWSSFMFIILSLIVTNALILAHLYRSKIDLYEIAVRAGLLGFFFGIGLLISFSGTTWTHFGWYLVVLSFFHWSEYFTTALTNPDSLTLESYLLDHSREYKLAALASWTEFFIEWLIFPGLKQNSILSLCGLILVIVGECIRKASMFTAKKNFNHYVQYIKQRGHQLVTNGVYSVCRHPSYVGWFLWSIGTQIILCNPCCLVGYTIVSWRFFRDRIFDEEMYLLSFFGDDYVQYQKRVGTGLPFIYGCRGHFD